MTITNVTNLPDSVVKLVSSGDRVFGPKETSVTTLLRPAQAIYLERQHTSELVEDAADRIWATYGTLMHLALERQSADNALVEEQLKLEVNGWTVFGTPDFYKDGVLSDFKFVSVWTTMDGIKPDWLTQLNFYAHMLRQHGFPVDRAEVVTFYRDWSKSRAKEHGYPPRQAAVWQVSLWPDDVARDVMHQAVDTYAKAMAGEFDECSDAERWHKPDTWAVTKQGNKRATRVLESQQEAEDWAARNVPTGKNPDVWFDIAFRPGEDTRCRSYCRVAAFCDQAKANGEDEHEQAE